MVGIGKVLQFSIEPGEVCTGAISVASQFLNCLGTQILDFLLLLLPELFDFSHGASLYRGGDFSSIRFKLGILINGGDIGADFLPRSPGLSELGVVWGLRLRRPRRDQVHE